jgi:hypothetical protein
MTNPPFESLEPFYYSWGVDDGDLLEPVRAHVLAALIPTDQPYPAPLDQLLTIGSAMEEELDEAFEEIAFLPEHADDLVRMARDRALHTAMGDSSEVWAPVWAIRALGQIEARDRIGDLIPLLDLQDDSNAEFLAGTFAIFGEVVIAPLAAYLHDRSRWIFGRGATLDLLNYLADAHPELRDRVVSVITTALEDSASNHPTLNGFILSGLLTLEATEALPVIRQAFEANLVDLSIAGDWPDVLENLHQPIDESDPLVQAAKQRGQLRANRRQSESPGLQQPQRTKAASSSNQKSKADQKKRKRKAASAARKTNKKRR